MAGEEENNLSWLSLKDFEEKETKIDPNWTGLEALAAVACLASEKLEEEKKRKEKEEKEKKSVESDGYWSKLVPCNGYERGSSSRLCDDRRPWLSRVSNRNERDESLKIPAKERIKSVADSDKPGSSPGSKDNWREREKALKKPARERIKFVADSDKPGSSSGSKDNWREREKALKKPVTNTDSDLCSKKKQGSNVANRDKLLRDAMKARIMASKDDYDEEWRPEYTQQKQKLNRSTSRIDNSKEEKDSKSNKKVKRKRQIVPQVTPDLPKEFREKMENLNGSKINLVIQKRLYSTDESNHHGRLSMPLNQILSIADFLKDDERSIIDIDGGKIRVTLIEPSLQESEISLTRWPKPKPAKDTFSYVLTTEWNEVRKQHKLKNGDLIQVWSFRSPDNKLCLALVFIPEENNQNNNGNFDTANSSEATANGSNDHDHDDQSPASEGMGSTTAQASNPTHEDSNSTHSR